MRSDSRLWLGGILALTLAYTLGTLVDSGGLSLTARMGTWPMAAAAGVAAVSLLYSARRRAASGADTEANADGADGAAALRYLGLAALAWCAGAVTYGVTGLFSTSAALSLTFGDLLSLVALPLFAVGFTRFAPLPRGVRPAVRHFTDSYVCAAAVFTVVWLVLFAPLYSEMGVNADFVGFALVYPVADIVVLCLLAPLVLTSPHSTRRAVLLAMGAFVIICGADLISTITRLTGEPLAGGIEHPVRLLGFALLAGLPWLIRDTAAAAPRRITGRGLYRFAPEIAAAVALAVASVVLTVAALRMDGVAPVLPLVAGSAVLVLLVRLVGLLEENATLARMVLTRERHFHELARNSGDVILILDEDGAIFYVSPGAAEAFGYRLDDLLAEPVTAIVHPEDLPRVAAAMSAFRRDASPSFSLRLRVRSGDGTWRHTESTVSRYERPGEPDRLLVTTRDISAQVALEQQVDHLTFHDGITGLPNRAYLEERTREVLSRHGAGEGPWTDVAAIFLDLDGFTAVNDSAGHTFGDYLLAQAARRLRATTDPGHTLARWGGDEFAVLIEENVQAQQVVDLAERLSRVIGSEPFQVAEREVVLTASVGVAFAERGIESGELLRNADMAMARAKEEGGGGRLEVYAAHMHAAVVRRLELQTELRQALADGDFVLEYQPVVDLESSQVTAVEALVRRRSGDTVIPPEDFIGAAEESGLIVPLGEWILREACGRVAQWRAAEWDIGLAVNLSVRQVLSPRFVETVATVLAESGLPAHVLTMEVDEEVLLENPGEAVARLSELRGLGVRLAIDDFGMGYASLAHLRQLRVDEIKIDPSFIRDLGTDGTVTLLTHTIIRLGQDLGVQVVAEGIERPEQLERLRAMGCGYGQGFLVAKPMAAAGVEALVGDDVRTPAG
ncbi:putative bifunctional diguanylate cyclase/phosphodiesterase [Marinitenerispora sediminis]|uniref:GGDEF domain-containing protein n=1 Tax=Marinitenerispora sediminis TaxID=1931232 RepID=A0A368T4B1_9ACTN|nr:GGDEF domain-containing phosphodiesterase [Marinitenerispora sediminis]RCV51252.1 GGDEF domain-containing protein [Marinitenerispora sediminis]RCV55518.1 GGDEF domain-containing protein [Marinitenerispora sediminis]RCV58072.1 GGDEF domain-containing protein [Marinitenerispora sediminis]